MELVAVDYQAEARFAVAVAAAVAQEAMAGFALATLVARDTERHLGTA